MAKYNYTYVVETIKNEGDILLSKEYTSTYDNLDIQCQYCTKTYQSSFTQFRNNNRCPCTKRKKYSIDDIREIILDNAGDKLLSTVYDGPSSKIAIECHICLKPYMVTINRFLEGNGCKKCSSNKYNETKEYIEKQGDKLISSEYISSLTNLDIKCRKCDQIFSMHFTNYKRGHRCTCSSVKYDSDIYDTAMVRNIIENNGEKLISDYINPRTHLSIQCKDCCEIYKCGLESYLFGSRCDSCNDNKELKFKHIKTTIENRGDKLISTNYDNVNSVLEIECGSCNDIIHKSFSIYDKTYGCAKCYGKTNIYNHDDVYVLIKAKGDILINHYENSYKYLDIECGQCKNVYKTKLPSILNNEIGCIKCREAKKHKEFENKNIYQ